MDIKILEKIEKRGKEARLIGRIISLKTQLEKVEEKETYIETLKEELRVAKGELKEAFSINKDIAIYVKTMTEEQKQDLLSGSVRESMLTVSGDNVNVSGCNFIGK